MAVVACHPRYDVVIARGRVIDPATGFDALGHLGMLGHTVAAIGTDPLDAGVMLDASGLIVAPGIMDLHAPGQDDDNQRFQPLDGGATALELERSRSRLVPSIRLSDCFRSSRGLPGRRRRRCLHPARVLSMPPPVAMQRTRYSRAGAPGPRVRGHRWNRSEYRAFHLDSLNRRMWTRSTVDVSTKDCSPRHLPAADAAGTAAYVEARYEPRSG